MSYNLHITKAEWWLESEENPILMSEWRALVLGESDMQFVGEKEGDLEREYEGSEEWIAILTFHDNGEVIKVPFFYTEGRIEVKYAHDGVVDRMKEIASKLGAFVIGDEGEQY